MHNLNELKIWNKAIDLCVDVYKATADFPADERYGLTSQLSRASVSVPSNIAEGAGRNSDKDFVRFLSIANGSAYEVQTQLVISNRLGLVDDKTVSPLLDQVVELQKMNYALQNKLSKSY
jgi:four helix bundle protein